MLSRGFSGYVRLAWVVCFMRLHFKTSQHVIISLHFSGNKAVSHNRALLCPLKPIPGNVTYLLLLRQKSVIITFFIDRNTTIFGHYNISACYSRLSSNESLGI